MNDTMYVNSASSRMKDFVGTLFSVWMSALCEQFNARHLLQCRQCNNNHVSRVSTGLINKHAAEHQIVKSIQKCIEPWPQWDRGTGIIQFM